LSDERRYEGARVEGGYDESRLGIRPSPEGVVTADRGRFADKPQRSECRDAAGRCVPNGDLHVPRKPNSAATTSTSLPPYAPGAAVAATTPMPTSRHDGVRRMWRCVGLASQRATTVCASRPGVDHSRFSPTAHIR